MWQAPNQRAGAAYNAKKRQQERNRKPFRLRRVRAEVRLIPPEKTIAQAESESAIGELREARVILNDLSPGGIGIYAPGPMYPGDKIRITLTEPRKIAVEGRVIWCQNQGFGNHVISEQSFNYRVGVQFIFDTEESRQAFVQFCEDLRQNYLYAPAPGGSV